MFMVAGIMLKGESMKRHYILLLSCPDRPGIVAAVTKFIAEHNGMISTSSQHGEEQTNTFFMRLAIDADSLPFDITTLQEKFSAVATKFQMQWSVFDSTKKKRVAILVSQQAHCLYDLLYRWQCGDMHFDIPCVISNHADLKEYVEWHKAPFEHVAIDDDKTRGMSHIAELLEKHSVDLIVLARFMQILPEEICKKYDGRIINIHHSFLPAFVGAKPYEQAFQKGVKLIGATCHFVTPELDQGPIIEQDVTRISHSYSPERIMQLGKDVERNVLAKGLNYVLEDRVLIHNNKTIIFD